MENLIVALTNTPVIYPILISLKAKDYLTIFSLIFVGTFFFLSHLVENHKHGMPGIGLSSDISYILNRLDVIGVFIVTLRMMYILFKMEKYYRLCQI